MTRRILLATMITGVLAGGASTALADATAATQGPGVDHVKSVCVVVFSDPSKPQRDGVCVDTPNLPI